MKRVERVEAKRVEARKRGSEEASETKTRVEAKASSAAMKAMEVTT